VLEDNLGHERSVTGAGHCSLAPGRWLAGGAWESITGAGWLAALWLRWVNCWPHCELPFVLFKVHFTILIFLSSVEYRNISLLCQDGVDNAAGYCGQHSVLHLASTMAVLVAILSFYGFSHLSFYPF
jgi:hypothetical protein